MHGVDRGGKSDPYAVFTLNGERVFKSSTKKKTINPEWHEDFAVSVVSIHM
jgi:Ca2+-dependent lipid-binding protein